MIFDFFNVLNKSGFNYGDAAPKSDPPPNNEAPYQSELQENVACSSESKPTGPVLLHEISVAIPFQCYSITLKHRLIDSLGGVSKFVLIALTQENVTLEKIKKITTLTDEHLEPFITRFIRLGWMTEDRTSLTQKGRAIAQATLLVNQSVRVWIDSINTVVENPFILLSDNLLQDAIPDGAISLTPKQQSKTKNARDQKERIERFFDRLDKVRKEAVQGKKIGIDDSSFTKFLMSIFDQNTQVIINNAADWYFDVDVSDEEASYIITTLPKGTLFDSNFNENGASVQFSLPCISCNIQFDQQSRKYFDVPNDKSICISLYSGELIGKSHVTAEERFENPLSVYIDDKYCKTKLENTFPSCSPLVSRTVNLELGFYGESMSIKRILKQMEKEISPWCNEWPNSGDVS